MDIKPFNPDYNLLQSEIIVGSLIGVSFFVAAFVLDARRRKQGKQSSFTPIVFIMIAFISFLTGMVIDGMGHDNARKDYYANFHEQLSSEGFTIVSGTPNLAVNTQSSMLLSYEGQNFDCTMFSPKDSTQSIVFSCGEAKLNLDQIKESK